ncbi:MAG: ATP-binding protein [Ignavibacteriaceae bacterium]|nr:ATP-binding protein [Ignavibacteriaceae bacterium]
MSNINFEILIIKSAESELTKVDNFLKNIFTKYSLSPNYFNKVLLCVSEAIINSIQHGNKRDFDKNVVIKVNAETECINIQIKDQGDGFDLKRISDPTKIENIKKESGRGLLIMRALCDSVEYQDGGNCICLKFQLK